MEEWLKEADLVLMEAAISEPLRRDTRLMVDPLVSISPLIYNREGRNQLERLFHSYMQVAADAGLPFLMCTPTWRASKERVHLSAVNPDINSDAVRFMQQVRESGGAAGLTVKIGGNTGCKNDCYRPQEGLSTAEAEGFHSWQINQLAAVGVDFFIAETLPYLPEAIGIARSMERTGQPYILSFVIDRNGLVLDGTPLPDAVSAVDAGVTRKPLGYMVNCSYPTFLHAEKQPAVLFERLIGYHANASSLDHHSLDCCESLQQEDAADWGREMLNLHRKYGIKILGGCCGTGVEHLRYLAEHHAGGLG